MTKFARTTDTKPAAKKTIAKPKVITPTTKVELPQAEQPSVEDEVLSAYAQVEAALDTLWSKMRRPSWVRNLVNITIGLLVYASTFYGCMALVDVVVAGAMVYTGVGFISFLIAFFAVFAAFMASYKVGMLAYRFAESFDYGNVKARVRGWFTFGAKPIATT